MCDKTRIHVMILDVVAKVVPLEEKVEGNMRS